MKVRFISSILIAVTMLSWTPTVYAESVNGDSMGDKNIRVPSPEQQLQEIIDDPKVSYGIRWEAEQQLALLETPREQLEKMARASTPARTLSVPVYTQETNYYCGPATTKQTMQYLTGKSDSQTTIAKAMGTTKNGTDGTRIVSYLNSKQSKARYTIYTNPSLDTMKVLQRAAFIPSSTYIAGVGYITKQLKPNIAWVKFSKGGNWQYPTNGHFFNVSGYTANQAKTRITDPYIRLKVKGHSGHYYVTYNELHTATKTHFAKHYYAQYTS